VSSLALPERDTPPTFFIDRSLGRAIIRNALQQAGVRVEIHDDHFKPDEADVVWLAEAGRRSWVVLTKDGRIRTRSLERIALREAGVHAFFLGGRQLSGPKMADAYVRALPAILRAVAAAKTPIWMSVHQDGRLTKLSQD
jgi:hypothetical protein